METVRSLQFARALRESPCTALAARSGHRKKPIRGNCVRGFQSAYLSPACKNDADRPAASGNVSFTPGTCDLAM